MADIPRRRSLLEWPTGASKTQQSHLTTRLLSRTCFSIPAFVRGSDFPPIPLSVTVGMLYSLHDLIFVSREEWPMDTEPQESSLTSTWLLTQRLDLALTCLLFIVALHISLVPGPTSLASSMYTSTDSSSCHCSRPSLYMVSWSSSSNMSPSLVSSLPSSSLP